eukprot:s340_g23.t1
MGATSGNEARGCLEVARPTRPGPKMGRRGQISIDRIVALRSSVLPIYVIIRPGGVTTADEVSEDGNDFLTTRMFGDQIAFQSIGGEYLSTEGGEICTRRYCSSNERFTVEKQDTQYAFRSCSGQYLSVSDRAPFVTLAAAPGETEAFQLFSLMMYGVNVGQQLEMLDRWIDLIAYQWFQNFQPTLHPLSNRDPFASFAGPAEQSNRQIQVAPAMREVAGLALWLASLTLAAAEGTTSEPFNCDWGRHNWHMGWSQPKKIYCCQHHQIGCEDHPPAQLVNVPQDGFGSRRWEPPPSAASAASAASTNSSHAIPPWWVVAGVHPDGPETDYGPYRMAGFSVAQQRQFGVDATGHELAPLHCGHPLAETLHRSETTADGTQPEGDDAPPGGRAHGCLEGAEEGRPRVARLDSPETLGFNRSNCQEQCMAHVLSWSLRTLWATGELLSQGGGASFGSVLADAVRTCYPGFRTLRADEVAHKVSKLVSKALEERLPIAAASGDFAQSRRLAYNQGPSCLEPGQDEEITLSHREQRQQFATQLEMAVERAVKTAVSKSWGTMEQSARPCQQTCRRAVVRQAAEMLWDAGLLARGNADMLVMTSVEGALAACLVNLPKDAAEALAGEAMLHMRPPHLGDEDCNGIRKKMHGSIMIDHLLDSEQIEALRLSIPGGAEDAPRSHELRTQGLASRSPGLAEVATHPLVMQLARRLLSPCLQLAELESCRTDVDFVRKELEETTWHVVHPYRLAEFPGVVDPKINITVTWFLDQLDTENSTWASVKAPEVAGRLPQLPQHSSPEELQAIAQNAQPLLAKAGAAWICIGPHWMSNTMGAASFWKDYDAQTRYKHLSGQKDTPGSVGVSSPSAP